MRIDLGHNILIVVILEMRLRIYSGPINSKTRYGLVRIIVQGPGWLTSLSTDRAPGLISTNSNAKSSELAIQNLIVGPWNYARGGGFMAKAPLPVFINPKLILNFNLRIFQRRLNSLNNSAGVNSIWSVPHSQGVCTNRIVEYSRVEALPYEITYDLHAILSPSTLPSSTCGFHLDVFRRGRKYSIIMRNIVQPVLWMYS